MNLEIYNPDIRCQTSSMISGKHEQMAAHTDEQFQGPVLQAFLADDDLQEIVVCSTNIGFVRTFTKSYRKPT